MTSQEFTQFNMHTDLQIGQDPSHGDMWFVAVSGANVSHCVKVSPAIAIMIGNAAGLGRAPHPSPTPPPQSQPYNMHTDGQTSAVYNAGTGKLVVTGPGTTAGGASVSMKWNFDGDALVTLQSS